MLKDRYSGLSKPERQIFWILLIVAILAAWVVLSAIILVSLCIASSRFNRQQEEEAQEVNCLSQAPYGETRPVIEGPARVYSV
jgi:flagellar basal body-associated protein FliL